MSCRSPPWFQGPRLVDEDPSPQTSLLLSTSDCTLSEQMAQGKQFNKRKKYPCRHFVRTGGWCPAGVKCKFRHDVAALPSTSVRMLEHIPPFGTDPYGERGRTICGGVLMGAHLPPPETTSHAHSNPQHSQAQLAQPYQPMYWPHYTWQPYPSYQPYYAPVPATTVVPVPAATPPPAVVQESIYSPPQLQVPTAQPSSTQVNLPLGTYEVNGTTYFPASVPSVPASAPITYPIPVQPVPYNYPMAPVHPYPAPPALPLSYHNVANQTTNVRPQTSFDPFGSDPMTTSRLPVIPKLEDYGISPLQCDVASLQLSSPSGPTCDLVSTIAQDEPTAAKDSEHEFPYRPPKNQRVGHARRISVNIKKHGRASSG